MGDEPFFSDFFKSATYAIKFNSSTSFEVINTTLWEVMEYNAEFPADGVGMLLSKILTQENLIQMDVPLW